MGKRYVQHSDLCGCERCARSFECDDTYPVYDIVDDPDVLDCGCDAWRGCDCPYPYDDEYETEDDRSPVIGET